MAEPSSPVDKVLKIVTTWSIPGWTAISLIRWLVAYQSHTEREFDECFVPPHHLSRACVAELDMIYQASVSTIWQHWWILTIILCLFWIMVRYANLKTLKEESDVSERPTEE